MENIKLKDKFIDEKTGIEYFLGISVVENPGKKR